MKNIEVSGLQVSDYRKRMPFRMRECFTDIFAMFDKGLLHPSDTTALPLDDFASALNQVRDRKAKGRLVLVPN